jgi:hypothetical protein
MPLEDATRAALLKVARTSIQRRFLGDRAPAEAGVDDPVLTEPRATFVTLKRDAALRGCIGVLEAVRPLLLDVAHNARAAAFQDPRFAPLAPVELADISIEISVLSSPEPLAAATRTELLTALKPGHDGLILQDGTHRATFLPAVWESLPQPRDFLAHLLHKAGLAPDHWSSNLRFFRYATESFADHPS